MLCRLLLLLLLAGCSDWDLPVAPARPSARARVEPVGDLAAAPSVLRLRVSGAVGSSGLADFRLFEGELSSYYLRRLQAHDAPETLVAREIAAVTWAEGREVVVAPTRALEAGVYSLATPELGLVAAVTVDPGLVPWLGRRWPPPGATAGNGVAVFCGDDATAAVEGPVDLAPAGEQALLRAGLDDARLFADSCVSLEPTRAGARGTPALPPPLSGSVALEPLPLVERTEPVPPVSCQASELSLGPACATIDDDRVVLRAPSDPSLWALTAPVSMLGVAEPGASLVVPGLVPESTVRLVGVAFDRAGARTPIDVELTGAPAHAHVVINEVLSNPRGPESPGEWLELANDGTTTVTLAGFALGDEGGTTPLPDAVLEPGELVLLAGPGFSPDPELDVPPVAGTRVIVLPRLGQSGLANAGELLRLYDDSGRVVSRFPALASPDAGVSVARRTPSAPDGEDASFGAHAAPGASPGASNQLADGP